MIFPDIQNKSHLPEGVFIPTIHRFLVPWQLLLENRGTQKQKDCDATHMSVRGGHKVDMIGRY